MHCTIHHTPGQPSISTSPRWPIDKSVVRAVAFLVRVLQSVPFCICPPMSPRRCQPRQRRVSCKKSFWPSYKIFLVCPDFEYLYSFSGQHMPQISPVQSRRWWGWLIVMQTGPALSPGQIVMNYQLKKGLNCLNASTP